MAMIRCENVALGYEGIQIAANLNFTLHEGNYLCIIGENGSGKTTLMKAVLGLLKPMAGEITYGDGLKQTEIGYLPQQTHIQKDFPASVEEVVLSGCRPHGRFGLFYADEDRKRAADNMERLRVSDLAKKCYRELSGGQQQRVLLARALCAGDRLLVLDEPVTGLDERTTADMYELIRTLNKEGITIMMILHDVDAAMRYASHILRVDDSAFFGTKEEYRKFRQGKEA